MKFSSLAEFVEFISQEPSPDDVKKNEDGSLYIPISIMQNKLDEVFGAHWDWEFDDDFVGKKQATGKGRITARAFIEGEFGSVLTRSGCAGVRLSGDMRMDYPLVEAMAFLSAARKFGKWFGRDLNRDRDDAPLPVIDISAEGDKGVDEEFDQLITTLTKIEYKEDAQDFLSKTSFKYSIEAKKIIDQKPSKPSL